MTPLYNKQLNSFCHLVNPSSLDDVGTVSLDELEAFFHALRRLIASKAGFESFTTLPKYVESYSNEYCCEYQNKNPLTAYGNKSFHFQLQILLRFREKIGIKVVKALKRGDDGVTHAAIDMLAALMQVCIAIYYFNSNTSFQYLFQYLQILFEIFMLLCL